MTWIVDVAGCRRRVSDATIRAWDKWRIGHPGWHAPVRKVAKSLPVCSKHLALGTAMAIAPLPVPWSSPVEGVGAPPAVYVGPEAYATGPGYGDVGYGTAYSPWASGFEGVGPFEVAGPELWDTVAPVPVSTAAPAPLFVTLRSNGPNLRRESPLAPINTSEPASLLLLLGAVSVTVSFHRRRRAA